MNEWIGPKGLALIASAGLLAGLFVLLPGDRSPQGAAPASTDTSSSSIAPAAEADGDDRTAMTSAPAPVGDTDAAPTIPESALSTGPSPDGAVALSAEGTDAVRGLAAILDGRLPATDEPAAPSPAEPELPSFIPGTGAAQVTLVGPLGWEPGDPIEVALRISGDRVRAVEALVAYDGDALEFGGVDDVGGQVQVLINDRGPALTVGAYACDIGTCDPSSPADPINELQLRFVPESDAAGHTIDIGTVRLVAADGTVRDVEVDPVGVGADAPTAVPGVRAWDLAAATAGSTPALTVTELDHTLDGRIDPADLSEAVLAWHEVRAGGDPCRLQALARHDVNGDGCIDVADLQTLLGSGLITTTVPIGGPVVGVPSPSAGSSTSGVAVSGPWSAVASSGFATLAAALDFDPYSWPSRVGEKTHVVNVTSDGSDSQLNDGVCDDGTGNCSLRAAILQSNADPGPNRIEFNIPGPGPHTIQLTDLLSGGNGRLPVISDLSGGVTIDGYSQPGAAVNTHSEEFLADIRIQVAGVGLGTGDPDAFTITSAENVIRGLAIHSARYGVYMDEDLAQRNHVVGNIIGTDAAATIDYGVQWGSNGSGLFLNAGPKFNIIGTPAAADRNVLSGNGSWAVRMDQGGTDGNIMWNNIIGLTPDGSGDLPNNGGVDIQWRAQFNVVGGLNVGERNVFSGSDYTGVDFSHEATDNYVLGNLMGTTLDGTQALSHTENTYGVILKDDAHGNYIIGNVLSNNRAFNNGNNGRGHGIWGKHDYTGRNTIIDNYIGLTIDGQPAGSERYGIFVNGHDDIIENNVIAHNAAGGIYVTEYNGSGANENEETRFNRISKNTFYGNNGLGIDIDPVGQNVNDPGDGDTGPNDRLNFPELTTVTVGQVGGTVCAGCEVEVYLADGSPQTQGQIYLGTAIADGGGSFTFDDAAIASGEQVTALAIDTLNNTSEFAPAQSVAGAGGGVAWSSITGMTVTNIGGTDFAITSDVGAVNNGGADATTTAVTFDLVAPVTGLYRLQGLVYAPNGTADSFWVTIDGAAGDGELWDLTPLGGNPGPDFVANRNVADPVEYFLTAGNHSVRVALREDGAGIATMALVSSTNPGVGPLPPPNTVPIPPGTPASGGGRLETVTASVANDWVPIGFAGTFADPIASCSVRHEANTSPVVVRMRNLTGTGMELRLQNPGDLVTPVADTVDCLVADAGAWILPDGTAMEAIAVDLTDPDHTGSWNGTPVPLSNTFSSPVVVLGQVMTENDPAWSTFWSRGNSGSNPPTPTNLRVGYHVGEDPDTTRAGERIGVIVLDANHGTLGGVEYETGRTPDIVTGPTTANHTFATPFAGAPTLGVVSQSAMDGVHGSWANVASAPTATGIELFADEDQVADAERTHPDEMVGYAVFASPLVLTWGASPGFQPGLVAWDDFEREYDEFWGVAPFGGAWQPLFGVTAREQFATNGRGNVVLGPGQGYEALLQNVYQQNVDTTLVATVDTAPDANFDVNVHQRWVGSSTFYRGRVRLQSDGSVRVQVVRADTGTFTSLGALNVPGLTFTPGSDLAIRMQSIGDGTTEIRVKVWDAAQPEPFGWSLTVSDASPNLQQPGSTALRFQIQSSSSVPNATFSVDDFQVIDTDS